MTNQDIVLSIKNISKSFTLQGEELLVLSDINLDIYPNEIFGILGHSGCGKTTLLRILCGLETKDSGQVILENKEIQCTNKDILMLYQNFNQLLPWKTVTANIVYPMLVTGVAKDKKSAKKETLQRLDELGLLKFADSYPAQLSGGMKQRIALIRALSLKPKVLVMDEPFANLDYSTKKQVWEMTRLECKKNAMTAIFVTHGVEEAVELADRLVVLNSNPGSVRCEFDNPYVISRDNKDKSDMMMKLLKELE